MGRILWLACHEIFSKKLSRMRSLGVFEVTCGEKGCTIIQKSTGALIRSNLLGYFYHLVTIEEHVAIKGA
jgi:hypothetical protein